MLIKTFGKPWMHPTSVAPLQCRVCGKCLHKGKHELCPNCKIGKRKKQQVKR